MEGGRRPKGSKQRRFDHHKWFLSRFIDTKALIERKKVNRVLLVKIGQNLMVLKSIKSVVLYMTIWYVTYTYIYKTTANPFGFDFLCWEYP